MMGTCSRCAGLDTLGWHGKEMRFGSGLWANHSESKRMISDAHDEAIDGWCARSDVLRTKWKPLSVGRNETVARLMTSPDADAAADGRTRASMGRTGDGHGAEWKTRRKMAEARKRLHVLLGRDGAGQDSMFDTLETG